MTTHYTKFYSHTGGTEPMHTTGNPEKVTCPVCRDKIDAETMPKSAWSGIADAFGVPAVEGVEFR